MVFLGWGENRVAGRRRDFKGGLGKGRVQDRGLFGRVAAYGVEKREMSV